MKTSLSNIRRNQGFILYTYMGLLGICVVALAAVMSYSLNRSKQTARENEYLATTYVAESLAEKIRASMQLNNCYSGESFVYARLSNYAATTISSDDPYFGGYGFSAALVNKTATNVPVALGAPFLGCTNIGHKYQIVLTASNLNSQFHVPVTIGLELVMSTMNIFHNAAFWGPGMDLEINPGAAMTLAGSVYAGGNIYISPGAPLTFSDDIAASGGTISKHASPLDPSGDRTGGSYSINGPSGLSNSNSPIMTLPLGTNQGVGGNTPAAVHAILEVPPNGESPTSTIGTNRYYNKADLIIKITDAGTVVQSATYNNNSQPITLPDGIINTNSTETFYDKREGKYARTTTVDVGNLKKYADTNSQLAALIGIRSINTLYVVDQRSSPVPVVSYSTVGGTNKNNTPGAILLSYTKVNSTTTNYTYSIPVSTNSQPCFPAITLTNGSILPTNGLTVATPDPVYVKGDYNTTTNGSNFASAGNTTNTRPAAIMCDAINILSTNWHNSTAGNSISTTNRVATNTMVNAAFLSGNVPSDGTHYSGGLENFPRFLENWSGKTFTYNGSMVCLFPSQIANSPWGSSDVYNPPSRAWAFDKQFLQDTAGVPPASPTAQAPSRGRWKLLPPGATSF